jgi:hypothetical protein
MSTKPLTIHDQEARHVEAATSLRIEPNPYRRTRWESRLAQTWGRGERGEWELDLGICKGCAREIDTTPTCLRLESLGVELTVPSTVCDDCMVAVREHYDPANQRPADDASPHPRWDELCPQRHRDVVIGGVRPAQINWAAYAKVLDWEVEGASRGLIVTGEPGTGKTTSFWALARKIEMAGVTPIVMGSVELARVLSNAAKDVREVGWLYRTRVLMVDDLGKEKVTPAAASLLWEVLDRRLAAGLPMIVTTNFTGAQLAERFGEEHLGDAIRRRLSELCRVVVMRAVNEGRAS